MATRVASPSLRGRFKLMLACALAFGLISWIGIVVYRTSPRGAENRVADAEANQPEGAPEQPSEKNSAADGPAKSVGDFTSRYGYRISLGGTDWARWDDLALIMPEAEFGALF